MSSTSLIRLARRAGGTLLAACLVAIAAACPSEVDGRVDRIGGPYTGGSSSGGGTSTPGGGGTGGSTGGGTGGSGGGTTPTRAPFVQVSAGGTFTCALTAEGQAYCWGYNQDAQLGIGHTTNSTIPKPVLTSERFVTIRAGGVRACGITAAGVMWCWGKNPGDILRTGTSAALVKTPTRVIGTEVWKSLAIGVDHMCGIDVGGVAYCWGGGNQGGELGLGYYDFVAAADPLSPVIGDHTWTHIAANNWYTCGRTTGGVTYCWGVGGSGVYYLGSLTRTTNTPRQTATTTTFAMVSGSYEHVCGIEAAAARVSCWGNPAATGAEGADAGGVPTRVGFEQDVIALSAGYNTSCVLTGARRAWCWGDNAYGQLGNGTSTYSLLPVEVQSATGFSEISVGATHACGIGLDGQTWCWGRNWAGELGNGAPGGTNTPNPTPVKVL